MTNHIFRKAVALIIVFTFAISCLAPLIDSITLPQLDSRENQISSLDSQNTLYDDAKSKGRPDGLAPKTRLQPKESSNQRGFLSRGYFYAYNAYDPSGGHGMGPITFDSPNDIELLAPGIFPNFCAGADMESDFETGYWYGCDYAGGLYLIERDTGSQTYIAGSIGVNGMTYDSTTSTWYVTSSNNLYTMDISTGATTLIGPHGVSNTFIGIACDIDGSMYAYDVLWTGDSTLYSIDKTTGAATAIGSMGYGFVYAQDMRFDRDYNILYIAGYFNDGTPSAMLTCDTSTGACSIVGPFEGNMEVDGFAIPWMGCCEWDHDIAINSILQPTNGNAAQIIPVVKVKNVGLNTETNVTVQLTIGKELVNGMLEDFEATNGSYTHFPKIPQPDAWALGAPTSGPMAAHSGSNVWATNLAGNYPPSMWCILQTQPFVVQAGAMFNFWHWYYFEANYDGGNVKISNDSGVTYTLIAPEGGYPGALPYNPFMTGQPAFNGQSGGWKQANFDLSAYVGQTVQIIFETTSDGSVQYPGWYIDDVGFTITTWANEYTQIAYIPMILPDEVIDLSFPTWTPADLGLSENININYNAEATSLLVGDQNPNNDYKSKLFTLHYGFFHDVAVTEIVSPQSGLAHTQIPEVVLENHGQNAESTNVQMTIGKALYTTLLEEDFTNGVPPAGWGTNYPGNWFSSSTNYAGGVAPEAEFSWSPSSVDEHYLWTGNIDTTGFTALSLKFKEYVNDYNGGYTLKVVTSIDGGVTWNDAYVRTGGPYGPTTTGVTLSETNGVGSANLQIAWDLSGDSFNINYWYIDDIWLGIIEMVEEYNQTVSTDIASGDSLNVLLPDWTPADIPRAITIDYLISASVSMNSSDGKPADNHLATMITLTYEHDVGTYAITKPFYEPVDRDEGWLQYDNGVYANAFGSTTGHIYGANRFTIDELGDYIGWDLDRIFWKHYGAEGFSGTVRIYAEGSSTAPGALITSQSFSITGDDWFDIYLDTPVPINGDDLWLCVEGTHIIGDNPLECSEPGISLKTAFFSSDGEIWYDLPGIGYDVAFEIRGHVIDYGGEYHNLLPGTYPIEGIVKNYGTIYSEIDIPVNTKVTNDYGEIVYDETVVIPGLLDPGYTAFVTFPNITIPDTPGAYGDYTLTMKTLLPDDEHPTNDKKILSFNVQEPYDHYIETEIYVSGTMGENGWYISNVTVRLEAWIWKSNTIEKDLSFGQKWPHGINHTYYKIDNGPWQEYLAPFQVTADGYHTISFYSDDDCIPPCVEEPNYASFRIDQTAPSITMSVEKVGFRQWKFIANVSDDLSGISLVTCFIDDMLLGNITEPGPYQWNWSGKGNHTVTGITYDEAGNSAETLVTFSLSFTQPVIPFISPFLQFFIKILERFKYMFPILHQLLDPQ